MRLDKYTADALGVTRSEAVKLIKSGKITVDGNPQKNPAAKVNETSLVETEGRLLKREEFIYIMMNKPAGYITAVEDKRFPTVMDLLGDKYRRYNIAPVGRLDKDTEGLLLLTNNGVLAHNLLSPKKNVRKTYYAELARPLTEEKIDILEKGVDIGGYVTRPCTVERLEETRVNITVAEGKFHQVKRMFEAVDNSVVYLKRISFAGLSLDESLGPSQFRQLCTKETEKILHCIQ